jgi:uncharacterized OB-fold protein
MAIIDEFGDKIVSVGKKTSKAFSDMSQISRLKAQINAEQAQVHQAYAQMGRIYFETYGETAAEEPFLSLSSGIRGGLARIARLTEEIRQVQDQKTCPRCGAVCGYGSMFCPACAFAFPNTQSLQQADTAVGFCSNCGAHLPAGAAFCTYCGHVISQEPGVAEPFVFSGGGVDLQKPSPGQSAESEEALNCSNCGKELLPESEFCAECGAKIDR